MPHLPRWETFFCQTAFYAPDYRHCGAYAKSTALCGAFLTNVYNDFSL